MSLTIQELQIGLDYWKGSTNWPQDFHASFYVELRRLHHLGLFHNDWWEKFLPILRQWRATRPKSSEYLTKRAQARFQRLALLWKQDILPYLSQDIESFSWIQGQVFVNCVAEIKNVDSPVFASKFCHFLAPHIFPVVDNEAMGNPFASYQAYYQDGRKEWCNTRQEIQNELTYMLHCQIGRQVDSHYPTKCKVIELCFIGRHKSQ